MGIQHTDDVNRTWHLVFTDSQHPYWFMRLLKRGYRHVYAMRRSDTGYNWVIVHPHHSHTEIELQPVSLFETPLDYISTRPSEDELTAKILTVRAKIDHKAHNRHFAVLSCVDIIKSLLGLKDSRCFTPYQLFKNITRGKYGERIQDWKVTSQASSQATERAVATTTAGRAA